MAVHLKKILGDLLYLEEPDQTKDHLPSPEDLRNKVMRLAVFSIPIFSCMMLWAPPGASAYAPRHSTSTGRMAGPCIPQSAVHMQ